MKSASPCRICINRGGIGVFLTIDDTATGSVGDMIAARANATAIGMAGTSQSIKRPTSMTVKTTSPNASVRTGRQFLKSAPFGIRQPSRKSSGGTNRRPPEPF